jgi:tetratricopeptide (TPR) repeat protein
MRFEEKFANALSLLREDSQSKQAIGEVCSSFWTWIAESVGEIILANGDTDAFIKENADLIDFGLEPSLVDIAAVRASIVDSDMEGCRVQVRTITQWLREVLMKAMAGDKVEELQHKLKVQQLQCSKIMKEVQQMQADRRSMIENMYYRPTDPAKQLTELENADTMLLESLKKKKQISKGTFLTVEEKRLHVKNQVDLQKKLDYAANFINTLPNKDGSAEVKRMTKVIQEELFAKLVDSEFAEKKISDELQSLQKKLAEMSLSAVENKITEDLEYIRDITRLSAKRLSLDPFPLVRRDEKVFSFSLLKKSLNQITEFDPHIFHNDRVPLFGRPYVLLVPSTGNAIYDWKNNCIVLPMIAPGANFMGSLASGIIEYRLDVDEDKKLLTSYNELPDLKAIRSVIELKKRLTKEYIIWMTSEANGYRILSKESKNWFEHEIGPSKNDIFTPLEYQSYSMSLKEYNALFEETTARIKEAEESEADPKPEPNPDDLWVASILYQQQGKPERALPLLEAYTKARPDHLMAWYNLGYIAMKQMNRTLARDAFNVFCKMDTQSWWAKVVRDHLRNLGPA